MKKKNLYLLILSATLLMACKDQDDTESVSGEASEFQVPNTFAWNSFSNLKVAVRTDNQFPGKNYSIEIFDSNPIINPQAALLAKNLVLSGQTYLAEISAYSDIKTIAMRETDPNGLQTIKEYKVTNGNVTADFNLVTRNDVRSATTRADSNENENINVVSEYEIPSDAIEINNNGGVNSYILDYGKAKHYVIKGSYKGAISFNGWGNGVQLYITGEWINTGTSVNIGNNDKLIVQPGGKVSTTSDIQFNLSNSALIFVGKNASFNAGNTNKVQFNASNGTEQFVNFGTVNSNQISQFKLVYNNGNMNVDNIIFNVSQSVIRNDKNLTFGSSNLTNGTVVNNCNINVTQDFVCNSSTTVKTSQGTSIKTVNLSCSGATINLDANTILQVTGQATFTSNTSRIAGKGTAKNYGLIIFSKEVSQGWDAVEYSGNIEIDCSSHSQNSLYNTLYTLNSASGAYMVPSGGSKINIEESDCNNGGSKSAGGGGTVPSNFPQTVNLGLTYSYVFEDTYPNVGDYDMNDYILDVNMGYVLSGQNKMSQLTLNLIERGAGGTIHLASGLQLDGISPSSISSIQRTGPSIGSNIFSLAANGTEKNQTYAVIPIVDDVHASFGMTGYTFINTRNTDKYWTPVPVKLVINFSTPIDITNLNLQQAINAFIINKFSKIGNRQEVHLKGYKPTSLAKDVSSGGNFTTSNNLVYGLCLPGPFAYPMEWKSIIYAYPKFSAWVKSNGTNNTDWQQSPATGNLYKKK